MSTSYRLSDAGNEDSEITLGILNAVHENERVTQRSVAKDLGIALGLTNAYLKRCIKKGLIKVSQAPANRYAYYLTPKGFSEKSRLTAEYLSHSFRFFRNARSQCSDALLVAGERGWRRIALFGASELAEVASLCEVRDIEIVAIVDPAYRPDMFTRLPVVASFEAAGQVDAVLLTALKDPQAAYAAVIGSFPAERVLVPALLRVTQNPDQISGG